MKNKKVLFFILLCVGAFVQAQETVRPFEEFFVEGMKKIDGVFPVYVADGEVYLEIPSEYIGREMQISAQIDRVLICSVVPPMVWEWCVSPLLLKELSASSSRFIWNVY